MAELWGQKNLTAESIGGNAAIPLGGKINHLVGVTATEISKPAGAKAIVLQVEVTGFRIKAGRHLARAAAAASWNITTNRATLTAHGYQTGDGPLQLTTTTTLPAGLSLATDYWIYVVDANTVSFCTSHAFATRRKQSPLGGADQGLVDDPIVVDFTTQGTGTHTVGGTTGFATPGASVTTGLGAWLKVPTDHYTLFTGEAITCVGSGAGSILTYWFL